MEQLTLFDNRISELQRHIEYEKERYELWAFIDGHGGEKGFTHGYLQCLRDIEKLIKNS